MSYQFESGIVPTTPDGLPDDTQQPHQWQHNSDSDNSSDEHNSGSSDDSSQGEQNQHDSSSSGGSGYYGQIPNGEGLPGGHDTMEEGAAGDGFSSWDSSAPAGGPGPLPDSNHLR